MDVLEYKGYEGTTEIDIDRGVCRGHILFISDMVTYEAENPRKLKKVFQDAVDDYVRTCQQVGKEPQKPFKGLFNVRVPPAIHKAASVRSVCDGVSLNEVVVQALTAYLNIHPDVYHHLTVTFEGAPAQEQTYHTVASTSAEWTTQNVH